LAQLYLDNDVSLLLVPLLERAGHKVTTTRELGHSAASDEAQLLTAVHRGEVFVTSNRRDFVMLHRAWLLWPASFDVELPPHSGILVIDQGNLGLQYDALQRVLSGGSEYSLPMNILWWHLPIGWSSLTDAKWIPIEATKQ
jgi:hypothetical protein